MPYVHQGSDLYLAADRETVVDEHDPRAAFVLVVHGGTLPDADAERYGLKSKHSAPANKLKAGAGENKESSFGDGGMIEAQPRETLLTFPAQDEEAVQEEKPKRRKGAQE